MVTVKTVEHLDGEYGMFLWPCAPVLAELVYARREQIRGRRVLELGAGTSVPGMVAAKCGAVVTLTEKQGCPKLLQNLRAICQLNGATGVEIVPLTWGSFSPEVVHLPPQDFILASDCLYDSIDFEPVFATVSYLIQKNPDCVFWCAYQERSPNRTIVHLLERWDLQCRQLVPPASEEGEGDHFGGGAAGVRGGDCPRGPISPRHGGSGRVKIEGVSEEKLEAMSGSHTIFVWEITGRMRRKDKDKPQGWHAGQGLRP